LYTRIPCIRLVDFHRIIVLLKWSLATPFFRNIGQCFAVIRRLKPYTFALLGTLSPMLETLRFGRHRLLGQTYVVLSFMKSFPHFWYQKIDFIRFLSQQVSGSNYSDMNAYNLVD